MKRNAEKRFLALALAFIMVVSLLPVSVFAIEMLDTTVLDGKIAVTSDGVNNQGSGKVNDDGSITVTTWATANCAGLSYKYTANKHTVRVTNNTTDETLMVEFAYNATGLGSLTIDGAAKTSTLSDTYAKSLAPGESIEIVITSPASGDSGKGDTATITLSDFSLKDTSTKAVTVEKPTVGGTVKVNGSALSANTTVNTDYATGVNLVATASSGYKFIAWMDDSGNVLSTLATDTIHPLANMTVRAVFASTTDSTGYWQAGGKLHDNLNAAITAAVNGDKTVILLKDTILPAGIYEIPAGVTLLIPFDEAGTIYGPEPELMPNQTAWVNPTPYCTLTLASGAKLEINGTLELAAKHHISSGASSVKYGGAIYGKFGHIAMSEGSEINVNNGGTLYAWGIISGNGVVTANSGSTVYEKMQINDYRGGTITSTMVTAYVGRKLFPFSQYYVQNIEVKEIVHSGATLMIHAGVFLSEAEDATVAFVGGEDAMFALEAGSYAIKEYDAQNDRLKVGVYGDASLGSIGLSFGDQNVNSSGFRMGINNNIDITIHSGVATVKQDMVLQSGATVTVKNGATLYNNSDLYIMDADDWGTFARGSTLMPVKWTFPNGTTVKRTSVTDAILDINGTVINNGQIYTSGSESVISSEGTGIYVLQEAANASDHIYQVTDNDSGNILLGQSWVTIDHTAAVLTNGDGSTVATAGVGANTVYKYTSQGKWGKVYTLTFLDENGEKLGEPYEFAEGEPINISYPSYTKPNYTTTWNMEIPTTLTDDVEIQAILTANEYAITLKDPDGTELGELNANVNNNWTVKLEDFSKEGYTFLGWSTDPNATAADPAYIAGMEITLSGNMDLYAVWEKNAPDTLKGDVNLDGVVDAADLTALARHVAEIEIIEDAAALANAEVTGDGEVGADDLTKLARYVAEIIDNLD